MPDRFSSGVLATSFSAQLRVVWRSAAPYLGAFLLVLTVYSFFVQIPGPNEISRADLVLALVHEGRTQIDSFGANTFDKARFEQHSYTDKAIGASLLGLPAYAIFRVVAGWPAWDGLRLDLVAHLIAVGGVAAPSAALVILVWWWCRTVGQGRVEAALIAGAYGFSTPAFPFATILFGHQTAAALLFAAFVLFVRLRRGALGVGATFAAGVLTGLAIVADYPAALAVAPFGIYLITSAAGRRALPVIAAGGLVGLIPLFLYNFASFGNPFRLAYEQIDDPASFAGATQGLFGVTAPSMERLWQILLGEPGILVRSPFLFLVPVGLVAGTKRRTRAEALVHMAIGGEFLLFNAAYYLPFGGVTTGPRFFLPALPFVVALLAFCPAMTIRLASPLIAASGVVAFALTAVRSKIPTGVAEGGNDVVSYWLPRLLQGDVAINWGGLRYGLEGLESVLPLLLVPLGAIAVLLASRRRADGGSRWAVLSGAAVWLLVSAPVGIPANGRVPAVFRQTRPLASDDAPVMRFGESIALLGWDVTPLDARLDSDVRVTLRWTALNAPRESYTVFVHALDPLGERIGQWDSIPGASGYPTLLWKPGQVVNDSYIVRLQRNTPLPTVATINVGLYRFATGERLSATSPSGAPYGNAPAIARVRLAGPFERSAVLPRASFGQSIELLQSELEAPNTETGSLVGRLRWRAGATIDRDYHTSIQVLSSGRLIAQSDRPPNPRYPTSAWQAGEIVEQPFRVELPTRQLAYPVNVILVVYDPTSGERLKAGAEDFVALARLDGVPKAH